MVTMITQYCYNTTASTAFTNSTRSIVVMLPRIQRKKEQVRNMHRIVCVCVSVCVCVWHLEEDWLYRCFFETRGCLTRVEFRWLHLPLGTPEWIQSEWNESNRMYIYPSIEWNRMNQSLPIYEKSVRVSSRRCERGMNESSRIKSSQADSLLVDSGVYDTVGDNEWFIRGFYEKAGRQAQTLQYST